MFHSVHSYSSAALIPNNTVVEICLWYNNLPEPSVASVIGLLPCDMDNHIFSVLRPYFSSQASQVLLLNFSFRTVSLRTKLFEFDNNLILIQVC